jgi:ketosteroid isomerase-like protein
MPGVKRTILSLLLCVVVSSAFGASFASDEQSLRRLEREQAVAMTTGDATWFRNHVLDDYTLITANGVVKTRARLIAELEEGIAMEPYEPADITIRAHDNVAIVSGRIVQKTTEGSERVTADLRFSDVWIRTDNGWFSASSQQSPVSIKRERMK